MSNITSTRSATTSPTLPSGIIVTTTSPSNQSTNTSPKKVTYQADQNNRPTNETRRSIDLSNMPTIITTKPPPMPINDLLKPKGNQPNQPTTTLCFICELPILSHQSWNTWSSNVSSPGLLTVSGIAAVTNEDYSGLNTIHHEGRQLRKTNSLNTHT